MASRRAAVMAASLSWADDRALPRAAAKWTAAAEADEEPERDRGRLSAEDVGRERLAAGKSRARNAAANSSASLLEPACANEEAGVETAKEKADDAATAAATAP